VRARAAYRFAVCRSGGALRRRLLFTCGFAAGELVRAVWSATLTQVEKGA